MKLVLGALAAGVAGALWLAAPTDRQDDPSRRPAAAATASPAPVVATPAPPAPARVVTRSRNDRLQVADPRTLKPLHPLLELDTNVSGGVLSPDGRRAAFPVNEQLSTEVRILDLDRNRMSRPIDVGGEGPAQHLTWVTNERLAVFSGIDRGGTDLVEIEDGRVIERSHFAAEPIATASRREGMVALLAPAGKIGRATLLIVGPRGEQSRWPLGLRAGFQRARPDGLPSRVANVQPGLAVDPAADVVYVADAEGDRLAEIDLRRGEGRYGPLGPARAAKNVDRRVRSAAWLGDGRLAIAGHRDRPDGRIEPHGLRIVDVSRPGRPQTTIAREQTELAAGAGRVVAFAGLPGGGIAIHGRDGRRLHRLLEGVTVTYATTLGPYAYVRTLRPGGRPGLTHIVDLRTGRAREAARRRSPMVTASAGQATESVLGIDNRRGSAGRLSAYDPLTLEPHGPRVKVPGYVWGWDRSPDGRSIALGASSRGRILIAGTAPPRAQRLIAVGVRSAFRSVRWVAPDRIIGLIGDDAPLATEIDPGSGAVLARHRLPGRVVAEAPTPGGVAVLTGPAARPGKARLLVLEPGGPPREIALPDVEVNLVGRPDRRPDDPPQLIPALAVQDGAAYVVPASGPRRIIRADLTSGAVTSHSLGAAAAKGGPVRMRFLTAAGGGRLLLATQDVGANGRDEEMSVKLLDTGTWRARTLATRSAGAGASAHGIAIPLFGQRRLLIHDPAGRRLATLRPRFGLSATHVHGRYVYVRNGARKGRNHRTHVVDLTTGRIVRTLRFYRLPQLLTRP